MYRIFDIALVGHIRRPQRCSSHTLSVAECFTFPARRATSQLAGARHTREEARCARREAGRLQQLKPTTEMPPLQLTLRLIGGLYSRYHRPSAQPFGYELLADTAEPKV